MSETMPNVTSGAETTPTPTPRAHETAPTAAPEIAPGVGGIRHWFVHGLSPGVLVAILTVILSAVATRMLDNWKAEDQAKEDRLAALRMIRSELQQNIPLAESNEKLLKGSIAAIASGGERILPPIQLITGAWMTAAPKLQMNELADLSEMNVVYSEIRSFNEYVVSREAFRLSQWGKVEEYQREMGRLAPFDGLLLEETAEIRKHLGRALQTIEAHESHEKR